MESALRDVDLDDAQAIARIYAHYVLTSCATFEEMPPDSGEIRIRITETTRAGYPWIVAESPSGNIAGYAYATAFKTRSAYRFTVENSVYVAQEHLRRGIGTALMRRLIVECERRGFRQMIAVIGDSANVASRHLHSRLGFSDTGILSGVGYKFGRWADAVLMQLPLTPQTKG